MNEYECVGSAEDARVGILEGIAVGLLKEREMLVSWLEYLTVHMLDDDLMEFAMD